MVHLGLYLDFSFPVLGLSSYLNLGDTQRHSTLAPGPHDILGRPSRGEMGGHPLSSPQENTRDGDMEGELSIPCPIPASPPCVEEMDTDGKHRFGRGFLWERADPGGAEGKFGLTLPAAFTPVGALCPPIQCCPSPSLLPR